MTCAKRFGWMLVLLALAACSHWQAQSPIDAYPSYAPHDDWTLRGKLGVRHGDERSSMHVYWDVHGEDFTLRLSAPVGGQQAVIVHARDIMTAALPDGLIHYADTPEELFENLYGWQAPVSSLRWWVRGLPDPAKRGRAIAQDNPLEKHWQQDGWTIRWQQYRDFRDVRLPGRIILDGPDSLQLTVIVQDWEWPDPRTAGATP